MIITLMKNTEEKIVVNKKPTTVATLAGCSLKSATSVIDPVIMVQSDNETVLSSNYMHIPELGRYYFITEIISQTRNLWGLRAHVDVLKTYADGIKNLSAVIARQENKWNLYLNDPQFQLYTNPDFTTTPFPNGFSGFQYVMLIAGF